MKNETILIVDDNLELQQLLHMLLSHDYAVIKAIDGRQGLEYANKFDPDLILLDMNMPHTSGIEMLEALRETDCKAPVIFITAAGSEYVAVQAFKLGVRDYIPKPFSRGEIEKAIDHALREVRLMREKERLAKHVAAAKTVRQTVTTLSHHINNKLMVVQGGLALLHESVIWQEMIHSDPTLDKIFTDSRASASYISAVLRVLQQVADVELSTYYEGEMMIDIKAALKKELQRQHVRQE